MSKKNPFAVVLFAAGALALYIAFAVGTGALFAHWHGRQLSRTGMSPQAPRFRLPPAWNDTEKRGQIASLCAAGGHVFAAGPGLGVYRSTDGHSWLPFNERLPDALDTTHLSSGPLGLFVIDRELRVFRRDAAGWSAIGTVPDSTRVVRLGSMGDQLAVATEFGMRHWSPNEGWTQPPDPLAPTRFPVRPRRVVPTMPTHGVSIESNERGAWFVRLSGADAVPPDSTPQAVDPSKLVWVNEWTSSQAVVDGEWQSTIVDLEFRPSANPAIVVAAGDARVYAIDLVDGNPGAPRRESKGLPPAACTSLAVNGENVFVGTAGFGVYRFDADHDRFEPANLGLLHAP